MAEVYGTAWIETARDKIKALLDALITDMSSGYDPKISYVYEGHDTAKIQFNALTLEFEEMPREERVGWTSTGSLIVYPLLFSVRVHTAEVGDMEDAVKISRLLNSVINKLQPNANLGDNYRIQSVYELSGAQEFAESSTIGGELKIEIHIHVTHT